jgi:hypothetical protein
MPSPQAESIKVQEVEADLQKLELSIRQLKIQYDQYFAGGRKRAPTLLRFDVVKTIKRYLDAPMPKLWDRKVREGEEGTRRVPVHLQNKQKGNRLVASYVVSDPKKEKEDLRTLHGQFVAARERQGVKNPAISFNRFIQGVSGQARRLQEESGCGEIELRLIVEDGKVQLRARPGR